MSPYGSVRAAIGRWEELGCSPEVLRWIRSGVNIVFNSQPRPFFHSGQVIETAEAREAWERLRAEYVAIGVMEQVDGPGDYCSAAFIIPKKTPGKFRLIVDLRPLNRYCTAPPTAYDDLRSLGEWLDPGAHLVDFDLKHGYFHLAIEPEYWKYFTFNIDGKYFRMKALPFGWSCSPAIFNTFMHELRRCVLSDAPTGTKWRHYLDDVLLSAPTRSRAKRLARHVRGALEELGVWVAEENSHWTPRQEIDVLGLHVCTRTGLLTVPVDKLRELKVLAKHLLTLAKSNKLHVSKRVVARFTGKAVAVMLAIRPALFFLRAVFDCMKRQPNWNGFVKLSRLALRDIAWWKALPSRWNGKVIWSPSQQVVVCTDASNVAWAGVVKLHDKNVFAHGLWTVHETDMHITAKELSAFYLTLLSVPTLRRCEVLWLSDSTVALGAVKKLSSSARDMMKIMRPLFWLMADRDLTVTGSYVTSEANEMDHLSRFGDNDAWELVDWAWVKVEAWFGPHSYDRFANMHNCKCRLYNSQFADPGSSGIDGLDQPVQSWREHNNWCNPPWALLPQLSKFLSMHSGIACTVLCPTWKGEAWYKALQRLAISTYTFPAGTRLFVSHGRLVPAPAARWRTTLFRLQT